MISEDNMQIEKTNLMNTLFEFYGSLLTDKQQKYLDLYYAEDFSLGEIASEFDVSRQAIYDNIKRTESLLIEYENKLKMVEQFIKRKKTLEKLKSHLEKNYPDDPEIEELIKTLS